MSDKPKVSIYTDGACSGNPGAGGYGAILVYNSADGIKHEKVFSEGYKLTTNNQMELFAVIVALETLKKPCDVTLYSDSKYVIEPFKSNWIESWIKNNWKNSAKKPVKNAEMWKRLLKAKEQHNLEFVWVKGHAGHSYNERCDKLAVEAYKQTNLKDFMY